MAPARSDDLGKGHRTTSRDGFLHRLPSPRRALPPNRTPVHIVLCTSRSASPVNNISRSARMITGQRRPSSALPHFGRTSWGVDDIPMFASFSEPGFYSPSESSLQRRFRRSTRACLSKRSTLLAGAGDPTPTVRSRSLSLLPVLIPPADLHDMFSNLPPHAASDPFASYNLAPIDHSPQDFSLSLDCLTASHLDLPECGLTGSTASWLTPPMKFPNSGPLSTYSGSPARSGLSLPVIAPRPVPAGAMFDIWHLLPSDQRQGHTRLCPRAVSLDDAAPWCTFRRSRWHGRPRIRDAVQWLVY